MTQAMASKLSELIRILPGYDPYRDAGDCWFDEAAAQRAIDFFPACLTHVKGRKTGKPFVLEPWQQAIVANLFGWKRPDGMRRYREVFIYIPRKNGKSLLVAGIAVYMLFCDNELGAEIYSASGDEDQASLCFDMAKVMVAHDVELARRAKIYGKSITFESQGSSYKPLTSVAETKHGLNVHCALIDELHIMPDRDLVDVIETSTGARDQPLLVYTTTADYGRKSICNEKHDLASKVRDGIISNPALLPAIYEASKEDDWTDPKIWAKANPNLGVSLKLDYMTAQCQKAKETPGYENVFKRLHLNIITEQASRWLQMAKWDEAAPIPVPDLAGKPCFAGLDLASTTDIAAFAMVFPLPDGSYAPVMRFWIAEDNARQREKKDRVTYPLWASQGLITLTPGNVIDYDIIRRDINQLKESYDIQEIAIDRWSATQITTQLGGDGFKMVPFGQGFASLSAPTKEFEKLVISLKFLHAGHPVLRWMASNVAVEMDAAGNLKPSKDRSTEKIDGIVACIMGLGRALVRDENAGKSVYDSRGIDVW